MGVKSAQTCKGSVASHVLPVPHQLLSSKELSVPRRSISLSVPTDGRGAEGFLLDAIFHLWPQ